MVAQNKKLKITIGSREFTATLIDNETVNAFVQLLPLEITMNEMGGYEKYYNLPQSLPGSATNPGTTYEGDLMIWSSNCLVLFYVTRSTSYSYIRLGRIDDTTGLGEVLGSGNVQVKYELTDDNPIGIRAENSGKEPYEVLMADNRIEVSGEFDQLTLFNFNGTLIAQSKDNIIQTPHLSSGVYLLKIDSRTDRVITKKVIKK